jgi:integrase/recombinase XerD
MKLSEGIEQYVAQKRAGGLLFNHGEGYCLALLRQVGDAQLSHLTTQDISRFLDNPATSIVTWRGKYQILTQFFAFWSSRKMASAFLMPPPKPPVRQTFVPYIYTRRELRALIAAAARISKSNSAIQPQTLRAFLILLYGTGTLSGEMFALKCDDVELKQGFLTVRNRNPNRDRRLPIGQDLQEVLRTYVRFRARCRVQNSHFFVTKQGHSLAAGTMTHTFCRLREAAGVERPGSAHQPRLLDLRFTFAVHRITSWIRNGANLNRMLPALAVYMGQTGLGATERYLSMTPEHFRRQLNMLSPTSGRKHWRDDKVLMTFLQSL